MNNNTHITVRRRANIITGDSFQADRESDTNREEKRHKLRKEGNRGRLQEPRGPLRFSKTQKLC